MSLWRMWGDCEGVDVEYYDGEEGGEDGYEDNGGVKVVLSPFPSFHFGVFSPYPPYPLEDLSPF